MAEHTAPIKDTIIRDVAIVLGIALLMYVSTNITPITIETVASGSAQAVFYSFFADKIDVTAFEGYVTPIKDVLIAIGLLFVAGIIWTWLKIREIHHHEHEKYEPIHEEKIEADAKTIQWQIIVEHVNSDSPAEWKLAILEADNILDEVLEAQGYVGETVAEKLKAMSRTKIASYDALWDAHKLRNEIAHGGAIDMELSQKTARDTISKFENAFKELGHL